MVKPERQTYYILTYKWILVKRYRITMLQHKDPQDLCKKEDTRYYTRKLTESQKQIRHWGWTEIRDWVEVLKMEIRGMRWREDRKCWRRQLE